jgi:hypothetical protein
MLWVRAWRLLPLLLGLLVALPSCSSTPAAAGAETHQLATGAYSASVLLVRTLDAVNATWMASLDTPTNQQLDTARAVTSALGAARDALSAARPYIEQGGDGLKELRRAYALLEQAAAGLAAAGVNIPPEATHVLDFVGGYVGSPK